MGCCAGCTAFAFPAVFLDRRYAVAGSSLGGLLIAPLPLFATLRGTREELLAKQEAIALAFRYEDYDIGEAITRQGEEGHSFYVMVSGSAKVIVKRANDETFLAKLGPGDYFGEIALLAEHGKRAVSVIALELRLGAVHLR